MRPGRASTGTLAEKKTTVASLVFVVFAFEDVYNKSQCQPRETVLDIFQQYPEDTEHTYIPSCVVIKRCGGFCNDEALECVATQSRNVTLQVSAVSFWTWRWTCCSVLRLKGSAVCSSPR